MSVESNLDTDIREATEDDVVGIVYVQATSWIKNYQNQQQGISEADVRSVDFQDQLAQWNHILKSPSYKVWVVKDEPNVLAFIAARKDDGFGEIYQQHTLPEQQRQGYGGELLKKALVWLKESDEVSLRIPVYVQSGLSFYQKFGFQINEAGELDFIRLGTGKRIPTFELRTRIIKDGGGNLPVRPQPEVSSQPARSATPGTRPKPARKKLIGRAKLAKASGVRASTIKYYSEIGILPFEQQEPGLARRYNRRQALKRLREIKKMRKNGHSIEQIKQIKQTLGQEPK